MPFAIQRVGAVLAVVMLAGAGCSSDDTTAKGAADASADRDTHDGGGGSAGDASGGRTSGGATAAGGTTATGGAIAAGGTSALDAGSDGGAVTGIPPEFVELCTKHTQKECEYRAACGYRDALDPADCATLPIMDCLRTIRPLIAAVSAGRVIYDATKLDQCLADAKKPFCGTNNLGLGVPSCQAVLRGTVAVGSPCYAPHLFLLEGTDTLGECDGSYCSANIHTCPGI
jgi:hypothetical protein